MVKISRIINTILKYTATLGFIGYLPFAPGTWASFFAFLIYILIKPSVYVHIFILLFTVPAGIMASHYAEKLLDEKDSGHIVVDEFCGYFLSMLFVPISLGFAIAAFLLFRFFDILKPFPIYKVESWLSGGNGIMADDLVAALYTNLLLQSWHIIASKF